MKAEHHILFISSWYPKVSGSAGTFVEMHLLALQSRGCKCAMLLNGEVTLGNYISFGLDPKKLLDYRRDAKVTFIDNLTVHKTPLRFSKNPIEKRRKNILENTEKAIRAYINREGRPDLIFHHGIFDYCYLSSFVARTFDLPIWYMENSPNLTPTHLPCANPFDSQDDQKDFVRNAERRMAVTEAYVNKMSELFGVPYELCPNVVTDDFFIDPDQVERPSGYFQFINVAILSGRKNQSLILKAFAKSFKGNSKFRLTIAGDEPLLGALQAESKALGIADQVTILGFQSRERIVQLLDASHCFVLSSRAETFGVVLVEALARGLPLLSTRIAGPEETVDATNGLLVEPDNSTQLAEAMLEVFQTYGNFDPKELIRGAKKRFGPDAVKNALFHEIRTV